jgi:hypothetical protein
MPDQQQPSWHHQPDIANLSPESYTAQKLVYIHTAHENEMFADRCSNMPRQSICTLPPGASSSVLSLYVPPLVLHAHDLHIATDSMAEQASKRLV